MSSPEIAVVIPALDATDVLGEQLDALVVQDVTVAWELLVVDNGSSDDTGDLARSYADRLPLRVLRHEERGINRARNAGIASTRAPKILFTDADDIVGPGWVRAMGDAVGPGRIAGGWIDRRHLPPDPVRRLDPEPISGVFQGEWLSYPIGCCMGWDRRLLEQIGGFDPAVFYGGDEVDAVWRARIHAGAEVVQAGHDAVLIRRERADPKLLRRQAATFGRGEVMLARRFEHYGHPGRLRRRAAWRAAKAATRVAVSRGPARLEQQRKLAYHGAAARQIARHALRLDPVPEPARLVR